MSCQSYWVNYRAYIGGSQQNNMVGPFDTHKMAERCLTQLCRRDGFMAGRVEGEKSKPDHPQPTFSSAPTNTSIRVHPMSYCHFDVPICRGDAPEVIGRNILAAWKASLGG